jgi:Nif-specific regulatory protein
VVEIALPPLRARGAGDVLRLAQHFLTAAARRHGRSVPALSPAARERLTSYGWPGNVRELENCLESAVVIMDGGEVLPEHLPLPERSARSSESPPAPIAPTHGAAVRTLADVEREHILAVLALAKDNKSLAAKLLGIGRNTLARKLKELGAE